MTRRIGAVFQEVRGKAVAQHVRGQLRQARAAGAPLDAQPERDRGEGPAAGVKETHSREF